MVARILVAAAAAAFVVPALAQDKQDAKKLEGTYTVVSGERDGKAIPAEEIKGSLVKFTADKVVGTDKDRKEFFAATYTVDTAKKPWTISMTSTAPKAGEKAAGVVQLDGDDVKLCYNLPGGEVPTEFKAKAKQHCFVLKRAKNQ